jgi:hypothetical protein
MNEGPEGARPSGRDASALTAQFVRELIIFLAGLLLGFFWYWYSSKSPNAEPHIVIGLIVIIMCMGRFIFLYLKH